MCMLHKAEYHFKDKNIVIGNKYASKDMMKKENFNQEFNTIT